MCQATTIEWKWVELGKLTCLSYKKKEIPMGSARLSSKAQLIVPKHARDAHCWDIGQELEVIDVPDGILT